MFNSMKMVLHYRTHRFVLGMIAVLFPLVLLLFAGPDKSISAFYWTNAGDILVGALVALGVFLITYNGYDKADAVITNIAGASIIGVALFPTYSGSTFYLMQFIPANITGILHYGFAVITFVLLGIMSLTQFSKSDDCLRNKIYRGLGISILAVIATMIPVKIFIGDSVLFFWQETTVVWLFGASWILKGTVSPYNKK